VFSRTRLTTGAVPVISIACRSELESLWKGWKRGCPKRACVYGSSSFGVITSSAVNPRMVQLAVKVVFLALRRNVVSILTRECA
jgi:hypothetical protein